MCRREALKALAGIPALAGTPVAVNDDVPSEFMDALKYNLALKHVIQIPVPGAVPIEIGSKIYWDFPWGYYYTYEHLWNRMEAVDDPTGKVALCHRQANHAIFETYRVIEIIQ